MACFCTQPAAIAFFLIYVDDLADHSGFLLLIQEFSGYPFLFLRLV
jgi:hypothetical protein